MGIQNEIENPSGKWTPPEWMKPYLPLLLHTDGKSVEELFDQDLREDTNAIILTFQISVVAQIVLLERLYEAGMLVDREKNYEERRDEIRSGNERAV